MNRSQSDGNKRIADYEFYCIARSNIPLYWNLENRKHNILSESKIKEMKKRRKRKGRERHGGKEGDETINVVSNYMECLVLTRTLGG